MEVLVDRHSVRRQGFGPTTGRIAVRLGDVAFPADDWDDFVVVILEALASALLSVIDDKRDRAIVHFMDGPYEMSISSVGNGSVTMRGSQRGCSETAIETLNVADALRKVVQASDDILDACRDLGDDSDDIKSLERAVDRIRSRWS